MQKQVVTAFNENTVVLRRKGEMKAAKPSPPLFLSVPLERSSRECVTVETGLKLSPRFSFRRLGT